MATYSIVCHRLGSDFEIFHFIADSIIREYDYDITQKMVRRRQIFTEVQKRIIACAQNYRCVGEICKSVLLLPRTWELDHIVPLSQDGTNDSDNLQIICPNCHALKTQKELMVAARVKRDEHVRLHRHRCTKRTTRTKKKYTCRSSYFNPNHQKLILLKSTLAKDRNLEQTY